ncbi:hypothetical protein WDU94_004313 [Cyamophila willieti]
MADKLGLNPDIRELKLGSSFTNASKGSSFHTLRYDFKPASMDPNEVAKLDVGASNQVTVTVPHGSRETVFKGSHKPYQKECVLIIDNVTGEITLEKLSNNVQLKKTRTAPTSKADNSHPMQAIPLSRLKKKTSGKANNNHKTKTSSSSGGNNNLSVPPSIPRHSPLQTSPSYFSPSPHTKSPTARSPFKSPSPNQGRSLSPMVTNSLPALGLDDIGDSSSMSQFAPSPTIQNVTNGDSLIGEISETSSSGSSNSSSDSDSDSSSPGSPTRPPPPAPAPRPSPQNNKFKMNGHSGASNGKVSPMSVPELLLKEDLQLSESSGSSDSE